MPRPRRVTPAGYCYHVLNRGNARQRVFHKEADYQAFLRLFNEAQDRCAMRLLAYCLMPNHFHLVLWPHGDGDVSRWMQWIQTTHVRRYHEHYHTTGHVWQGRFKAFPIQEGDHLLTVLRYVERNPFRAGLVPGDAELVALRRSVERGVPYGSAPWQKKTIAKLGLESTLRPRGRPRKAKQ